MELTSNIEKLRYDILGLTHILSILRHQLKMSQPHTAQRGPKTVDDMLIHITNLLNTGSPPDLVVAVSGSPSDIMNLTLTVVTEDEAEHLTCTAVVDDDHLDSVSNSHNSSGKPDKQQPKKTSKQPKRIADFAVYEAPLDDDNSPELGDNTAYLDENVIRQARALFLALRKGGLYRDVWVLQSCIQKIYQRITSAGALTPSDVEVFNRMGSYQLTAEDRIFFNTRWPQGIHIATRKHLRIFGFLVQRGFSNEADIILNDTECVITVDTVEYWIKALGRLRKMTEPHLKKIRSRNKSQKPLEDGDHPTMDSDTSSALAAFRAWCGAAALLKDLGFSEFLASSSLLHGIVPSDPSGSTNNFEDGPVSADNETNDTEDLRSDLKDEEIEDIDIADLSPAQKCLYSFRSYFRLVTSWHHSSRILTKYTKHILTPQFHWKIIHIVPIRPRAPLNGATCVDMLEEYIGKKQHDDEEWLQPLQAELSVHYADQAQIHCEATLMALAVKPSSAFVKAAGIEKVMETMHDTISVTKKCCCGCFLLGEVLLEKRKKKFNLFGTHGRVFPWMPPADLDEDILQTLKDRFVSELQRAIRWRRRSHAYKQYANFSSPASSASSDDEDSDNGYILELIEPHMDVQV